LRSTASAAPKRFSAAFFPAASASATRRSAVRRISVLIGPDGPMESASGTLRVVLMRTSRAASSSETIEPNDSPVSARRHSLPGRSFVSCSGKVKV
jgi:hypothetical protein